MMESGSPGTSAPGSTRSSLLQRARDHDPEAWRRLVALYGPLVLFWCRQHLPRTEDRADVFQDVFRAVAAHLGHFRKDQPGDSFRGWLLTITRNKVRDHVRKQHGQPSAAGGSDAHQQFLALPDPLLESGTSEADQPETALLHRALDLIRGDFEEPTWQAFWRAAIDGHEPADIARDLGISVNAVYKAKARVFQRLRKELGDVIE